MPTRTLWYSYCPGPNAVGIAGDRGWLSDEFAPDGIVVRTLASSSASRHLVHQAHQLVPEPDHFPYLLRHGGNPPPLVALSRGVDLRIVGLTWTEASRRVLALEESGIRTPADLKGRRLAVPRRDGVAVDYVRSVTLRTYTEALAAAALTFDDVELVEVKGGRWGPTDAAATSEHEDLRAPTIGGAYSTASTHREEAVALIRGDVDVVAGEHAQVTHLQATLRLQTVFDTALLPESASRASGDQPLVLTASGALFAECPELVARWIARALDAADWARDHRVEARRFIAADVGLAEGFIDVAYSPSVHEQLAIDLDQRSLDALRVQHDHLLAHGFLAAPLDVERFVDPAPLAVAQKLRSGRQPELAAA